MSLILLAALALGVAGGVLLPEDASAFLDSASSVMLLALLFSVGIDMGRNKEVFARIKELGLKILLIPAGVAAGSLFGGAVTALLIHLPLREGMAISFGLGWYSLSGILLTEAGNPTGGAVSFLANVFREAITFVIVPFLAGHLNFYCAIAPAGATAMDTTLGVISKNTDSETAVLAFVSGVVCTLLVPVLVPLFL
ncbi:MAG: lysine exporter LysO family protein [Anaerotignum sp.]|nr:lysine exporter LysO family protein [Anaerotignum sp.]